MEKEQEDNRNNAPAIDSINLKEQVGNTAPGSETVKSVSNGIGKKMLDHNLKEGVTRKEMDEMLVDSET